MRVLHVISDENIGGAGVLLTTLLRNFDPARVESIVALPNGSALCERIETLKIPVCRLEHPSDRFSAASVREISNLIRSKRVDIVHANAALNARFAGKHCGIAVLHTRHCCFPPEGIWRYAPVRYFGGLWNRVLSDRVIATADAAAENLRSLGIPQKKIEVIINGSEPVRTVGEDELNVCRKQWRLEADDFVVGICARLEPCKGHETFLRAAKVILEKKLPIRFRFLIVGNGSRFDELRALTETLGISEQVVFTGFVRDMAPIYRLLRVNVNCSSGTETSCLALSEGMSAGVPAAVSDYGGNRAMIGESNAGVIFPIGDAEALADAIVRIACDGGLELQMRRAAYERYEQNYTAAKMTEHLTAVYEKLLEKQ